MIKMILLIPKMLFQVQIKPAAYYTNDFYALTNQEYELGLYNRSGTCVYADNIYGDGNNLINLDIDVLSLSNGIYITCSKYEYS